MSVPSVPTLYSFLPQILTPHTGPTTSLRKTVVILWTSVLWGGLVLSEVRPLPMEILLVAQVITGRLGKSR